MTGDGIAGPPRLAVGGADSVVWTRTYGKERFNDMYEEADAMELLEETLVLLGISDGCMVVGHTPQMQGVNNGTLQGKLWKVRNSRVCITRSVVIIHGNALQ